MRLRPLLIAATLAFLPAAAFAQSTTGDIHVAWSIPDSPAAAAIDVARGSASPPNIMSALNYEILHDDNASGVAGEVSPELAWRSLTHSADDPGSLLTIDAYQRDRFLAARARVSISGAAAFSDQASDRAAIGVRWTVFNRGDPYAAHRGRDPYRDVALYNAAPHGSHPDGCLVRAVEANPAPVVRDINNLPDDAQVEDTGDATWRVVNEAQERAKARCIDAFQSATWNATSLQLVAVQTWRSPDAGSNNLEDSGLRYGAVFSYGFEELAGRNILRSNSQILLSAFRGQGMLTTDDSGDTVKRDETTVALRLRFAPPVPSAVSATQRRANGNDFNIYFEGAWSQHDYTAAPEQEEWAYTFGAEYRLPVANNVWVGISSQRRSGDHVTGDDTVTGVQLRWALSTEAQFGRGN